MNNHTLEYYLISGEKNNSNLSRTLSKGIIDTTVSADKPKAAQVNILDQATTNYNFAVHHAFTKESPRDWFEAQVFIHQLYLTLEDKLLKAPPFLRTHQIPKEKGYGHPVEQLEKEFERFCDWYAAKLWQQLKQEELDEACALTQKIVDKIHFFADGCGRMSRILSMKLCMKNDAPVRLHTEDSKTYYKLMGPTGTSEQFYDPESSREWIKHYKQLPFAACLKIGLDFDDVIANSIKAKAHIARNQFKIDLQPHQLSTAIVKKEGIIPWETYQQIQKSVYYSKEVHQWLEPIDGAIPHIKKLHSEGNSLRVVTNRDEEPAQYARTWQEKHGLTLPLTAVGMGISKTEACQGLDIFVDDDYQKLKPLNVPHKFWLTTQPDTVPGVIKVKNWVELYAHIKQL